MGFAYIVGSDYCNMPPRNSCWRHIDVTAGKGVPLRNASKKVNAAFTHTRGKLRWVCVRIVCTEKNRCLSKHLEIWFIHTPKNCGALLLDGNTHQKFPTKYAIYRRPRFGALTDRLLH